MLDRFESEMSPMVFFDRVPLCRCSDETKEWLMPLIHDLWMRREYVNEKVGSVRRAYDAAEQTYETVRVALGKVPEPPTVEDLSSFERVLRIFTTCCETLSRAISALPHEIRCI
jgi:hypothetical protein